MDPTFDVLDDEDPLERIRKARNRNLGLVEKAQDSLEEKLETGGKDVHRAAQMVKVLLDSAVAAHRFIVEEEE